MMYDSLCSATFDHAAHIWRFGDRVYMCWGVWFQPSEPDPSA